MLFPLDQFDDLFEQIGKYAREHSHRLTFHLEQFKQVGAQDSSRPFGACRDFRPYWLRSRISNGCSRWWNVRQQGGNHQALGQAVQTAT